MTADPRQRADGICALEGCNKPLRQKPPATMPKHLRHMFMLELAADPFCSTGCCREWHHLQPDVSIYIAPAHNVTKHFGTAERNDYRNRHRVPCEGGCGKHVEGKGRSTRPGQNPGRPFLCQRCANIRNRELEREAREAEVTT